MCTLSYHILVQLLFFVQHDAVLLSFTHPISIENQESNQSTWTTIYLISPDRKHKGWPCQLIRCLPFQITFLVASEHLFLLQSCIVVTQLITTPWFIRHNSLTPPLRIECSTNIYISASRILKKIYFVEMNYHRANYSRVFWQTAHHIYITKTTIAIAAFWKRGQDKDLHYVAPLWLKYVTWQLPLYTANTALLLYRKLHRALMLPTQTY